MKRSQTRICVPICVRRASELAGAIARAVEVADIIELRLDYLDEAEFKLAERELKETLRDCPRPLIFTLRPAEQGGHRALDEVERTRFWTTPRVDFAEPRSQSFLSAARPSDFADLELDLLDSSHQAEFKDLFDKTTVICSHHDFAGLPTDLDEIYERMARTPAPILKLAVAIEEITDCLPLFRLLERARLEGREMIAIAMGEAGLLTRILGPSRGAFLTYGSLDVENQTAPGQPSAVDLRELYRIERLDRRSMITGLIGSPVAHSFSPRMHNAAFKALDLDAVYLPFAVREAGAFIRRMAHPQTRELDWNLRGLSVTAPHKTSIMEQLDWVEPSALELGAVNTIVVEAEELRGFNTDGPAFVETLSDLLGALDARRCAVIGAGGAARGVLWGLQREGARTTLFARDAGKAKPLAEKFGAHFSPLVQEARFDGFDAVINTTPLGTRGPLEAETPARAEQLHGAHLAYDLVYNPYETRFIREAREAGCRTTNGLSMLVAQAATQFYYWTGMQAPVELMRAAAQAAIKVSPSAGASE